MGYKLKKLLLEQLIEIRVSNESVSGMHDDVLRHHEGSKG